MAIAASCSISTMSGMGGLATLHKLQDNPLTWDIQLIAVAARAMPQEVRHGKAAGFRDVLTGPINAAIFST
jgi:CheY-like chemotaxis protein